MSFYFVADTQERTPFYFGVDAIICQCGGLTCVGFGDGSRGACGAWGVVLALLSMWPCVF